MTTQPHADPSAVQRRVNKVARDVTALLVAVERLTAERDTARAAQIALEQELALKDEALGELRALANKWWINPGVTEDPGEPILRILDALGARISAHLFPTDEEGASDE